MSGGIPSHDDEGPSPITEINITPMVDIMLVLLIIFMVTANIISNPALKVELPKGGAAQASVKEVDVVVLITRSGEIQFQDRPLPMASLLAALKKEHSQRPNARLLIIADRKAYHGSVVRVMDIAKTVGFQRLGVATHAAK
jgi:biopolymer transport protein ExbD